MLEWKWDLFWISFCSIIVTWKKNGNCIFETTFILNKKKLNVIMNSRIKIASNEFMIPTKRWNQFNTKSFITYYQLFSLRVAFLCAMCFFFFVFLDWVSMQKKFYKEQKFSGKFLLSWKGCCLKTVIRIGWIIV